MSLLGHIKELRTRLLVCVIALVVTTALSFAFSQTLAEFLAKPIGGLQAMSSIDVTENVSAFMKISLLSGVIMALPVILFEVMAFLMPGLHPKERAWIWMVVPSATIFFSLGVAFAYFFMLPTALPFLLNFMGIVTSPRPNNYFSFVTNLMFWVGVSFELPLVMYILARLKIISARGLVKQWRIALVGSAVLAALITPTPDPVNMGLMMLPLFGLYLLSIIFAIVARRERKEKIKKKISRRARIVWIVVITIVALAAAYIAIQYPDQARDVINIIGNTLLSGWNAVATFFRTLSK